MSRRFALLLLFLAQTVAAGDGPSATTLYKSVGPDGKIVYGDRPPGDGRSAQTLKFENLPSSPLSPATLAYLEELKKRGAAQQVALPNGELLLFTAAGAPTASRRRRISPARACRIAK